MKNVAIVYRSRNGQTEKIAEYMKAQLLKRQISVQLINLSTPVTRELNENTDGVIAGGPVYAGNFPRKLTRWLRNHHVELHSKETAFFTVSLNAADKRPESRPADDQLLQAFIDASGIAPTYAASFGGALAYRAYSWPIRRIMKRQSQSVGGPADTSRDYEFTDWAEVDHFLSDFVTQAIESPFLTQRRLPAERRLNQIMPEFEQHWALETMVDGKPDAVFETFRILDPRGMKLAGVLAKIRTLGRAEKPPEKDTFIASAERFGNVTLVDEAPREMVAGLIGQFWRPDFGIRRVKPDQFASFNEPGFVKVVTGFHLEPIPGTERTRVRGEMRIHATSEDAARKFKVYWTLLNPGIRLYMRSMMAALRRQAVATRRAA